MRSIVGATTYNLRVVDSQVRAFLKNSFICGNLFSEQDWKRKKEKKKKEEEDTTDFVFW